jgi:dTDP-4-dehydrorhamnose reductase
VVILLGGTGYVGGAFVQLLERNGISYRSLSRRDVDYYNPKKLAEVLAAEKCDFLINAAGYTGKPNVDACEIHRADCLLGNGVLPGLIREACEMTKTPWGHVSSGCIFTGARPDGTGFREQDPPNFDFRHNNCSFYSGSKALGEECLDGSENVYIWRLRIPFNHEDSPRNYLSKVQRYARLLDATNSISHLNEFVKACWDCWAKRVPFGKYNVTNTGSVTTREVVDMIKKNLKLEKDFQFFESESEFLKLAAKTPRSNCVMDNSKLLAAGIQISEVHDAIEMSLKNWKSEGPISG